MRLKHESFRSEFFTTIKLNCVYVISAVVLRDSPIACCNVVTSAVIVTSAVM